MCLEIQTYTFQNGVEIKGDHKPLGINPEDCPHYDGSISSICDPEMNGRSRIPITHDFYLDAGSATKADDEKVEPTSYNSVNEWLASINHDFEPDLLLQEAYSTVLKHAVTMDAFTKARFDSRAAAKLAYQEDQGIELIRRRNELDFALWAEQYKAYLDGLRFHVAQYQSWIRQVGLRYDAIRLYRPENAVFIDAVCQYNQQRVRAVIAKYENHIRQWLGRIEEMRACDDGPRHRSQWSSVSA